MTALYVRFHVWRGFSLFNSKPDFFSYVFRLGFCTVYVCKVCLLNAYRKLRTTIENVVGDFHPVSSSWGEGDSEDKLSS